MRKSQKRQFICIAFAWKCGPAEQGAFIELKRHLTCATTLDYFDLWHQLKLLLIPAHGLGVLLVQRQRADVILRLRK